MFFLAEYCVCYWPVPRFFLNWGSSRASQCATTGEGLNGQPSQTASKSEPASQSHSGRPRTAISTILLLNPLNAEGNSRIFLKRMAAHVFHGDQGRAGHTKYVGGGRPFPSSCCRSKGGLGIGGVGIRAMASRGRPGLYSFCYPKWRWRARRPVLPPPLGLHQRLAMGFSDLNRRNRKSRKQEVGCRPMAATFDRSAVFGQTEPRSSALAPQAA